MDTASASLAEYLAAQIQDLIELGPTHTVMWASKTHPGRWMQVSVHGGMRHYLTVQVPVPPRVSKKRLDRIFTQSGWWQVQANRDEALLYYLAIADTPEGVFAQTGRAARQCADAMQMLWNVNLTEQVALLGARGPLLPLGAVKWPHLFLSRSETFAKITE